MRLAFFDAASVAPQHLVNRKEELTWLTEGLDGWMRHRQERPARQVALLGDKGSGKSILAGALLLHARERHSSEVVVVQADCRSQAEWRSIFAAIFNGLHKELHSLQEAGVPLKAGLMESAKVGEIVASGDNSSLRTLVERSSAQKAAFSLKGSRLMDWLNLELGFNMERQMRRVEQVETTVSLTPLRLAQMLRAMLEDLTSAGLGCVLLLDNLDELHHHYWEERERDEARRQVEAVLLLTAAPCFLLITVRSYFGGILPRQISERRVLEPLPAAELREIVLRRLQQEGEEVRGAVQAPAAQAALDRLVSICPTPLVLLEWTRLLLESGHLRPEALREGIRRGLRNHYAQARPDELLRVFGAFHGPDEVLERENLQAHLGSTHRLKAAEDNQVVLPLDFWNPLLLRLEPFLQAAHPSHWPEDAP